MINNALKQKKKNQIIIEGEEEHQVYSYIIESRKRTII